MINKICIVALLFWGVVTGIAAQNKSNRLLGIKEIPFRNEFYVGGGLHTSGWNINLNYSLIKKKMRTLSFFLEFGELKNPKEYSKAYDGSTLVNGRTSQSFVYGKQNNFYTLRLGYGEKIYLSSKDNNRAISLAWTYSGGLSVGLLKPYYLNLIYRNNGFTPSVRAEKYSASNIAKFLNIQEIAGPAAGSYGWDEAILEPGLFIKTGLLVDWGAFDEIVKGFEIGLSMDSYFNSIPILVFEENTPIFVNLYLHVYLGKRW